MKTIKTKRQVLDISMIEEEFFEDAFLMGIVCPLPSYRFIWNIEQYFHFLFERRHEFEVEANSGCFEVYTCCEEEKLVEHTIYTNRKGTSYLIPEAKNIDFIWMIKGSYLPAEYRNLLPGNLQNVAIIDHCFIIDAGQLKSRQHLIL